MAADTQIPELDRAGLRKFGFTTGGIFAVLFGLLLPWLLERPIPLWPWVILAVLGVWALVAPASLRPVYRGWMTFGLLASRVMTPLILGIVFFILISPIGLFRRLIGAAEMRKRFQTDADSYRVPSAQRTAKNLEKPF